MDVSFDRTPREFGIAVQVDPDFAMGYYLIFEPNRQRIQYKTGLRMYEDGGKMFPYEVEQERPFAWEAGRKYHVRVFVQDSILLLYVDDQVALGTRMFDRNGYRFGLFVSDGSAAFGNIRLLTE
jgi:beta-fructofuranosidase